MTDTMRNIRPVAAIFFALVMTVLAGPVLALPMLTDSAVFSSNELGINWNGWIWNTRGAPDDRWNLYYSTSLNEQSPSFVNSQNDGNTNINIALAPGTNSFLIYGESVTPDLHPLQHFVLSLYFDGNAGAPDISGLYGSTCPNVCAASNANGLDLFGLSGLSTPNAQEAGTLSYLSGGYEVTLSNFDWVYKAEVDKVWPHWDNTLPYNNGSGTNDFVGLVQLDVRAVPAPGTPGLLALGLVTFLLARKRAFSTSKTR